MALAVVLVGTVVAFSGSGLDHRDAPYVPDAAALIGRNVDDVHREFPEFRAGAERDGYTNLGQPSRIRGLGYTYEFGLFEISDEVWADGAGTVYEVVQKTTVPESAGDDRKARAARFYDDLLSDWTGIFGPPSFAEDSPPGLYEGMGARVAGWYVGSGLVRCISYDGPMSVTVRTETTTRPGPNGC